MQHQNWIAQARAHWQEHQPKRYSELSRSGQLLSALKLAAEQTAQEVKLLTDQGATPDEAFQAVREQYLFPPEEPGNSPEAPKSHGYKAMRHLNRDLSSLTLPGEREN